MMSFKYSVIGDNTPENREWLEKIGYKPVHSMYGTILYTCLTLNEWSFMATSGKQILPESFIDCIGNPQLFRAVTAMSDDSDYMQWFTDGKEWILCIGDSFGKWYYSLGKYLCFSLDTIHKATLEELKEHFQ